MHNISVYFDTNFKRVLKVAVLALYQSTEKKVEKLGLRSHVQKSVYKKVLMLPCLSDCDECKFIFLIIVNHSLVHAV